MYIFLNIKSESKNTFLTNNFFKIYQYTLIDVLEVFKYAKLIAKAIPYD